ncbi:tail fiber domain-containing protein [Chryseobacterium sp.]|uniref:tail fiber domain-containing protein n=1 Tax=Chryseobacterium sp. TaxID=1871047 RepID=UPI0025BDD7DD|nr:tail fiber domain-containing protein [Chryseobacterium sp.]
MTTLSVAAALLSYGITAAQSVGINTAQPGSTLDVNGSFAAKYTAVTSTTYAMTSADFYIAYNGTANAAFTLPAAISGTGNFKGRMYTIKNNTAFSITVNPSPSETINGNTTTTIAPNQSLQLISTGLTGAVSTWDISSATTGITASNGLGIVGNDVRLGGILSQNTAIDYLDKALYFRSNVNGFGLTAFSNANNGASAGTLLQFTNDAGNALNMFLNSSTKTTDGGANAGTINNVAGPLLVAGNNNTAQVKVGTAGLQYYYNNTTDSWVDINGFGDINMNRPEDASGIGGNRIAATKGHIDLSGYNTLNPLQPTQIYLGKDGFKYSYNGSTQTTIDGVGNIHTGGAVFSNGVPLTSDMRLKTRIKEIGYGLRTVMALEPKQYELSDNKEIKGGKPVVDPTLKTQHRIGFLAQDLYKQIPEAVHKPKDDSKEAWAVDYTVLVPALTKAIQEQQAEIERQNTKIKKMEAEMQAIKKKLGL